MAAPGAPTRLHEQGLTLVELMVVVAIVAVIAMVAIPALLRDRTDTVFYRFARSLTHDVRRAHMEAITSKEHRQFSIVENRYTISSVSGKTLALLATRDVPPEVEIAGVMYQSTPPGKVYSPSSLSGAEFIRMLSTGGVQVKKGGSMTDSSVTVFLKSADGLHKARVEIYQATAHTKMHKSF